MEHAMVTVSPAAKECILRCVVLLSVLGGDL